MPLDSQNVDIHGLRDYSTYPKKVVREIAVLRGSMDASGIPGKIIDYNLLIATWNIRAFGKFYTEWEENTGSPKRNLRGLAYIVEIIKRFDIVAIQEVKRDIAGVQLVLDWLGPHWEFIISDVATGDEGNTERLAFIFDRRRVTPFGLAGEIVLPETDEGKPADQFDRSPYVVGFEAGNERFVLVTAHIKYGRSLKGRKKEIADFAQYVAKEMRDRISQGRSVEQNLIVLGDFNINKRGEDPLYQEFKKTGLVVPRQLEGVTSTFGKEPKYYDQIAWFKEPFSLLYNDNAGSIDFAGDIFKELTNNQMSYRVSDHFPLWVEFRLDRSREQMAAALGA